jgi:hypothetical protein
MVFKPCRARDSAVLGLAIFFILISIATEVLLCCSIFTNCMNTRSFYVNVCSGENLAGRKYMNDSFITGSLTALATVVTAVFTYVTTVRKERKAQVNTHRLEILQKVYTPIYRVIMDGVYPGDGYEGLTNSQLNKIYDIITERLELVDPRLEQLVWSLKEDQMLEGRQFEENIGPYLDEDREFLDYVEFRYNDLRKSLGLPYDSIVFAIEERWRRLRKNISIFFNRRKARRAIRRSQMGRK